MENGKETEGRGAAKIMSTDGKQGETQGRLMTRGDIENELGISQERSGEPSEQILRDVGSGWRQSSLRLPPSVPRTRAWGPNRFCPDRYRPVRGDALELPQGLDHAGLQAAYDRWRNSLGVILGQLVMAWVPLMVSGLCGVFASPFLPASIPAALLRTVAVASLLSMVLWVGGPVVERANRHRTIEQHSRRCCRPRLRSPLHLAVGPLLVGGDTPPHASS